jgi:hypothetical protein
MHSFLCKIEETGIEEQEICHFRRIYKTSYGK